MEDTDEDGCFLVNAALFGLLHRVKFYLEEKKVDVNYADETGFTALHRASGGGHIEVVKYLISRGANVNAIGSERSEPRFRSITPLLSTVTRGHVETAKILIKSGARTDALVQSRNLLDEAILSNNPEMVSLVVSHGFDINRHNKLGMTPLAIAMSLTADESIKFLLKNGADYKKTSVDEKLLPISHGIYDDTQNLRCVEILLKHVEEKEGREGVADYINYHGNSEGNTALHKACYSEYYDAVKLFLECGADPNIRNKKGEKPCDVLPAVFVSPECKQIKDLLEPNKQHSSDTCYFLPKAQSRTNFGV